MEIVDRIIEELRPVADKLGEGAEFLWATLIKQIMVRGIVATVASAIAIGVAIWLTRLALKYWEKTRERGVYGYEDKALGATFGAGILYTFGILEFLLYALPRLINPSYYALKEILRTVT